MEHFFPHPLVNPVKQFDVLPGPDEVGAEGAGAGSVAQPVEHSAALALRGPVDFFALARLAAIFRGVIVGTSPRTYGPII